MLSHRRYIAKMRDGISPEPPGIFTSSDWDFGGLAVRLLSTGLSPWSRLHRLTTQAQRPGARDATMATATLPPRSLQLRVTHQALDASVSASQ
jgi:hypothetical protein